MKIKSSILCVLFISFILSIIGLYLIWAVTHNNIDILSKQGEWYYTQKQIIIICISCFAFFIGWVISRLITVQNISHYGIAIYLICFIGIVLALSPLGSVINGGHSWIVIGGGFSIQPTEFMKCAMIILFGYYLTYMENTILNRKRKWYILLMFCIVLVPLIIIKKMNDFGSVLILFIIVLSMLFISTIKIRYILLLISGIISFVVISAMTGLFHQYQFQRLLVFLDPTKFKQGAGYAVYQAKIATASGGWFGQGIEHSYLLRGSYVPEQQTDFIFSSLGEIGGFLYCSIVLLLFLILFFYLTRIIYILMEQKRLYELYITVGFFAWIAFQMIENVGMNIGITPVTGVPVPFLSYGGSSLLAIYFMLGFISQRLLKIKNNYTM